MSWNDERVELLKKMWGEGRSASQIAKELGAVTRNAVIGKVHRLGLSNRVGMPGQADGKEADDSAPEAAAPRAEPRRLQLRVKKNGQGGKLLRARRFLLRS